MDINDDDISMSDVLGGGNVDCEKAERLRMEEEKHFEEIDRSETMLAVILDAGTAEEKNLGRIFTDITPVPILNLLVRGNSGDYPFPADVEENIHKVGESWANALDSPGEGDDPYWILRELETIEFLEEQIEAYGSQRLTTRFDAEYGERRHAVKADLKALGL